MDLLNARRKCITLLIHKEMQIRYFNYKKLNKAPAGIHN